MDKPENKYLKEHYAAKAKVHWLFRDGVIHPETKKLLLKSINRAVKAEMALEALNMEIG